MRAVILAGGLGTRPGPSTTIVPTPLVAVGDRPLLEHVIRSLAVAGVDRVDVCVGHLGHLIRLALARADLPDGLALRLHWEDEALGTAGALRLVPDLDETAIVMNGDVLTNLDFRALVDFHLERDAALTLSTHRRRVDIDLGVVESEDGVVLEYVDRPSHDLDVSTGVYVCHPRALAYLPEGPCSFGDLVLALLEAGQSVAAFGSDAWSHEVGTLAQDDGAVEELVRSLQTPETGPRGVARVTLRRAAPGDAAPQAG